MYKKADWEQIQQMMLDYYYDFLNHDPSTHDVEGTFSFVETPENTIQKFISVRSAKTKNGRPWDSCELPLAHQ